ncbi:MAG TPA: dienelactone hydrolase [Planctomycetaceae bacterium]|nr:dienelactone hydrolase [Planctomycetaceae bacterium]
MSDSRRFGTRCVFRLWALAVLPLLSALVGPACGQDVAWLPEVTRSPAQPVLEQAGRIAPLLAADGSDPADLSQWQVQRKLVRQQWLQFLGPMPEPPALDVKVVTSEQVGTVVRQLVEYTGEPGLRVQGYLLVPHETVPLPSGAAYAGKRPAVAALHQTTNVSIDEIAGVSGPDAMQIGLKLARRGFIVFCPRCFLWQDVSSLNEAVQRHRSRHPQTLGMAKMLYDASRAVDLLSDMQQVDSQQISAIGHSLGAKEVLYLAALDERVRAAVSCEGGLGFRSTNWDAEWYLGPAIRDPQFPLNHHQLLALAAPRPLLIVGGESGPGAADGDRSWVLINAALPVWKLYPGPIRLGLLNHGQGHSIPDAVFEQMAQWLTVYAGR